MISSILNISPLRSQYQSLADLAWLGLALTKLKSKAQIRFVFISSSVFTLVSGSESTEAARGVSAKTDTISAPCECVPLKKTNLPSWRS